MPANLTMPQQTPRVGPQEGHLDKVHPCKSTGLHEQHSYVVLRCLNAAVQHAQEDRRVIVEVHHELLRFLHQLPKRCGADGVCVVEE